MRVLLLGGVAGPVLFSLVIIVSAAWRSDYSHLHQFISELGATGTANAGLMNFAGFVPTGLMLAAFGAGLGKTLPQHRLSKAATVLLVLFGLGVAVSGLISCDPGCPQTGGSVENLIHDRIAPIIFMCLIIGVGILGIYFRSLPDWQNLSVYSQSTSAVALCFLIALAGSLESRILIGLWQRLMLATLFLWCSVVALRAYKHE